VKLLSRSAPLCLLSGLFAAAACGDDHGHDDGEHSHGELSAECQAIVDACHHKDTGDPGPVHDCHTVGHEGDRDACIAAGTDPRFGGATCPAVCEAAPTPDGGTDHGFDGG
jgi:hypothetical protein